MKILNLNILFFLLLHTFCVVNTTLYGQQSGFNSEMQLERVRNLFAMVSQANSYTEELQPADLNILPIGLKKTVNNMEVTIAIDKVIFGTVYMELSVFARAVIPQGTDGKRMELFFGASGIKLSYEGSIVGDATLSLLADIEIPFNNGNTVIVLKGGYDATRGISQSETFMSIDCKGFKELGVNAEVVFPKTLLRPASNTDGDVVKGHFQTVIESWNDLLVEISLPSFYIVGLDDFEFNVRDVVFDFSDSRNSQSTRFPSGYEQKYMVPGAATIWRGVSAREISITLPKQFSTVDGVRTQIAASDMIIDDYGISGHFTADNVLPFDKGSAGGWNFSVNSFELQFEANKLIAAGFGGRLGLPFKGENTSLDYTAIIKPNNEYIMQVASVENIDFSIFNAKASILPNSYVTMHVVGGEFRPTAVLHGQMRIMHNSDAAPAQNSDFKPIPVTIPTVEFRSLTLKTEAPYLTVEYFGYAGKSFLGNFPISINSISLHADSRQAYLSTGVSLALMEGTISAGTNISFMATMREDNNKKFWAYEGVRLDAIDLKANIADFIDLNGKLIWMQDDPVYGNGFSGDLQVCLTQFNNLKVNMRGAFGVKDDYRYWFADGGVVFPGGIPVYPPLTINGISGGVTYRMRGEGSRADSQKDGSTFTSMNYVPDKDRGLGFKAAVLFLITEKIANGEASFEIAFSKSGGLSYAGFFGFAQFPAEGAKSLSIPYADKINEKYNEVLKLESSLDTEKLQEWKQFDPNRAAAAISPIPKELQYGIMGTLGVQFDFKNKSLHATTDIYVNTPGGFLQGTASGNRAGWGVLHVDPSEWYLHLGSPTDRLGLQINLGNIIGIKSGSYLMAGSRIPEMPAPPIEVANLIREDLSRLTLGRDMDALGMGTGFAFGSDFRVSTGDLTFLMMYAKFVAGAGFDFMLKDYGDLQCRGRSGVVGMNGWYAKGQAYTYLQGELGVNINLWFLKKKVPIIEGGAAALLQTMLPNPSSLRGYLGVNINVLGLIKGSARFKISLGEECDLVIPGSSPIDMAIINDISPRDNEGELSVFTMPQATFNIPVGQSFDAENDNGLSTYRVQLKSFTLTGEEDGNIAGTLQWNAQKDAVTFQAKEILPPKSRLQANVRVIFEELKNGQWRTVVTSGKEAMEEKTFAFTTGGAPEDIPMQNIVYAYPVVDQKYFLPDEDNNGYVQLQFGQKYLFEKGFDYRLLFSDRTGKETAASFNYNESANRLEFKIPELDVSNSYILRIAYTAQDAGEPQTGGYASTSIIDSEDASVSIEGKKAVAGISAENEKSILNYAFSSSRFRTFPQKMKSLNTKNGAYVENAAAAVRLLYRVQGEENFDETEISGIDKSGNVPLIQVRADLREDFYTSTVAPLVYNGYPYNGLGLTYRDENPVGVPPYKSVFTYSPYVLDLQKGVRSTNFWFPYTYEASIYFEQDFRNLQSVIVNNRNKVSPAIYERFAAGDLPFLKKGMYKVTLQYVLPDGKVSSSTSFEFNNFLNLNE
ncbi:MAG: hypothetical protein LBB62_05525 [Proteiniphilum sp.]|jgi:hypothetical protein|nr:hypothetical protein [Proteiniphilum sp.]